MLSNFWLFKFLLNIFWVCGGWLEGIENGIEEVGGIFGGSWFIIVGGKSLGGGWDSMFGIIWGGILWKDIKVFGLGIFGIVDDVICDMGGKEVVLLIGDGLFWSLGFRNRGLRVVFGLRLVLGFRFVMVVIVVFTEFILFNKLFLIFVIYNILLNLYILYKYNIERKKLFF